MLGGCHMSCVTSPGITSDSRFTVLGHHYRRSSEGCMALQGTGPITIHGREPLRGAMMSISSQATHNGGHSMMMSAAMIPTPPASVACLLESLLHSYQQQLGGPIGSVDVAALADEHVACDREVSPGSSHVHISHEGAVRSAGRLHKRGRPKADAGAKPTASVQLPRGTRSNPANRQQLAGEYLAKRLKNLHRSQHNTPGSKPASTISAPGPIPTSGSGPRPGSWALGHLTQSSREQQTAVSTSLTGSDLQGALHEPIAAAHQEQCTLKAAGAAATADQSNGAAAAVAAGLDVVIQQQLAAEAQHVEPAAGVDAGAVDDGSDDWLQLWHAGLQQDSADAQQPPLATAAPPYVSSADAGGGTQAGGADGAGHSLQDASSIYGQLTAVAVPQAGGLVPTSHQEEAEQVQINVHSPKRCPQQQQQQQQSVPLASECCSQPSTCVCHSTVAAAAANGHKDSSLAPIAIVQNMQQFHQEVPEAAGAAATATGRQPGAGSMHAPPLPVPTAVAIERAKPSVVQLSRPGAAAARCGGVGGNRFTLASLLFAMPELPIKQVPDGDSRPTVNAGQHQPGRRSPAVAATGTTSNIAAGKQRGAAKRPFSALAAPQLSSKPSSHPATAAAECTRHDAGQQQEPPPPQQQQRQTLVDPTTLQWSDAGASSGAAAAGEAGVSSDEEGEVTGGEHTEVHGTITAAAAACDAATLDNVVSVDGSAAGDKRKRKKSRGGRQARQRQQRAEAERAAAGAGGGGAQGLYAEIKQWEKENSRGRKHKLVSNKLLCVHQPAQASSHSTVLKCQCSA